MDKIELSPIGIIHSPLKKRKNLPVQPKYSEIEGKIEIFEEYSDGLKDIEAFEYIICICFLHKVRLPISLQSSTHWDQEKHGIFAIRSPLRPNPLGLSILKLLKVVDNIIYIKNLDYIDKTPVLDIKPFVPSIDNRETDRIGWFEGKI